MEYVIGAVIAAVVIYVLYVKRSVNRYNKLVVLPFGKWLSIYNASVESERYGISLAFLLQTLNLAESMGVLSKSDRNDVEVGLKKQNPSKVVDEWLEMALPNVIEVGGQQVVFEVAARDAGLYMLICVMGVNPKSDLRRFLARAASGR